jgi:hypothetical protein
VDAGDGLAGDRQRIQRPNFDALLAALRSFFAAP